jgi:hypothetical protein
VKNIKRIAAIAIAAGGLAVAGAGVASAQDGPMADGGATMSPGVASGNNAQVPVHVPVKVCGNTISVIGTMNSATGTPCN